MNSERYYLLEKIDRVKDAELNADLAFIIEQLNVWRKAKPDNKPLLEIIKSFVNVYSIMQSYQTDRQMYHIALSEYRGDKTRALERARRSEAVKESPDADPLNKLTENNGDKSKT